MAIKIEPVFEDHHNPMIRCKEETVDLMGLFMAKVQDAIGAELDKRGLRADDLRADCYRKTEARAGVSIHFNVHLKGPDDIAIEFRGIS